MRTTEILCGVSIPQSGLQAFRPVFNQGYPLDVVVSIPQSGLQAFRLCKLLCGLGSQSRFNPSIGLTSVPTRVPLLPCCWNTGFNPSIGLTSVPTCASGRGIRLSE